MGTVVQLSSGATGAGSSIPVGVMVGDNAAVPRIQGDWDVSECVTLTCHYTFECVNSLEDTNTRGRGQKEEQFKKKSLGQKYFPKSV